MNRRSRAFAITLCAQVAATGTLFAIYAYATSREASDEFGALSLIAMGAVGGWFVWRR